ncbi:MAG TPA: porin [Candidatus Aquabacterium excrementipullorum]|nr:porin [Candidatus Aquabacterium excrementipullorum]
MCAAALCCLMVQAAQAQSSSVTFYGDIDQYFNYMSSSSGAKIKSLQDGALLRSRIGFRGTEVVDGGLSVKFNLESGLSSDSGSSADSSRFFDRQAWVSLVSPTYGELKLGRQNTAVFTRGGNVDFTARTLGSIVNNFGVPARYDNDVSWASPVWSGWQAELHFAPGETSSGTTSQAVYQIALDYSNGPFKANYASVRGKPPKDAAVSKTISYDNVNANYDYGSGKVYAAFVRSNNITSSSAGNTAGSLLGGTGTLVTGAASTEADAKRFYNVWQLSADYRVSSQLRVGGLWGQIVDTSNSGRGAKGGALGAFYDFSKRTTVYALTETMSNDSNAGFRPFGSAALSPNFTGSDVNGQKISGAQVGIVHKF